MSWLNDSKRHPFVRGQACGHPRMYADVRATQPNANSGANPLAFGSGVDSPKWAEIKAEKWTVIHAEPQRHSSCQLFNS